jgi:hypothetical protein
MIILSYESFNGEATIKFVIQNKVIKTDNYIGLNYNLFYKDTLVGIIKSVEISEGGSYVYTGVIFSENLEIKLGENTDLNCVKSDNFFYPEFFNNVLTVSGAFENVDYKDNSENFEYEFIPVLEKNCIVNTGDLLGYIKVGDRRFPILVPSNIFSLKLKNDFPVSVGLYKPINYFLDQGLQVPMIISDIYFSEYPDKVDYTNTYSQKSNQNEQNISEESQIENQETAKIDWKEINNEITDAKDNNTSGYTVSVEKLVDKKSKKSIITVDFNEKSEVYKFLHTTDIVISLCLNKNYYEVKDFTDNIKKNFEKENITHVDFVSFSNHPFFSTRFEDIIVNRLTRYLKQFLHQGNQILVVCSGVNDKNIDKLLLQEGEYKTKLNKSSSLRVVELRDKSR